MPQGRKWKMGHRNMHKLALGGSQLSKTDTGDLTRRDTAHPTERCHKGENDKRVTRTCTRHSGGHNLAKLIWVSSNKTARPKHARSGELARCDTTCPTERCHKGENNKQATQMCTRHPGSHNLAKLIWAPSNETARIECAQLGDLTRHDSACLTE